jgi:ubiquinone biosynthesis accessory factor UbiJ
MPATPVWLAAIESVLNRSISGSQKAQGLARRLDRTSLQVDVEGFARIRAAVCGSRLALTAGGTLEAGAAGGVSTDGTANAGGVSMDGSTRASGSTSAGGSADAIISGSPFALFKLLTEGAGRAAGPPSDRARASAHVAGDAEVAGRYRELFALARPDLEEELSRLVGDLPARRLSLAAQGAISWIGKLGRTVGENVAEYLQEESRDLPAGAEVEEFLKGVDRLRDTADRVEARLARIEQRLKGAP